MKILMTLFLSLLAGLSGLASAAPQDRSAVSGAMVEMSVVDRQTGLPLPVYRAQNLDFIEGTPGNAYAVRLVNRTGERLLVVLAVDGINAITGKTAAYNQAGYVLGPYSQVEIAGWRQSMDRVARFVFTRPQASYASRTGRGWQVGVIGAAVFREDRPHPVYRPAEPMMEKGNRASAPGAAMEADSARSVGTGYGQAEWSQATVATFIRQSSVPDEILRLDYDDRSGLYRRGIRVERDLPWRRPGDRYPDPFPEGFAQPPRW